MPTTKPRQSKQPGRPKRNQFNIFLDKSGIEDLLRMMSHPDVHNQTDAVTVALKIAANHRYLWKPEEEKTDDI